MSAVTTEQSAEMTNFETGQNGTDGCNAAWTHLGISYDAPEHQQDGLLHFQAIPNESITSCHDVEK